jgi:multidrug efflux system outer membrane protein
MTRMKSVVTLAICAITLLTGCSLIPNYQRPDLPVAPAYPTGAAYKGVRGSAEGAGSADTIGWRDFFTDPRLQRLIEIALRNNRDLRVAMLNVAAAQAQFRVQRSALFPQISLSTIGEFGSLPANAAIPVGAGGLLPGTGGNPTSTIDTGNAHESFHIYNPGIGFASYELDTFGRLRSLTSEAFEQYLGTTEMARSAQISLVAEIASAYLAVLADQALMKITRDTLKNETANYELTNTMFKRGSTTMLSVRQAETAVDTARANIAQYTRQAAQDENALVLLLGEPMPADLPRGKGLDGQGLLSDLRPGLPSDLLFRRPDIVAAEHDLIAANANIGAARAAFFPSITLTASGGLESSQLSRLFTKSALTWSFEPQINLPIFTGGQNEANLDRANVEKNIQVAQYEKTIQTAFREVSDSLAARKTYIDQVKGEQQLVDATADTLRLSTQRFQGGVDDYLPVLEAQQSLYAAQQALLFLKQARLGNLVTLYKVLGGGWHARAGDPADVSQPM